MSKWWTKSCQRVNDEIKKIRIILSFYLNEKVV